jgi:DNA processing protein
MVDIRVPKSEMAKLLPQVEESELQNKFAAIAWSVICEPGDGFAGLLVSALGAEAALETELHAETSIRVKEKILQTGIDPSELDAFGVFEKVHHSSRERWKPRLSLDLVRNAIYGINKFQGEVLTPSSPSWPVQLNDLGVHSPMAIWLRGKVESLAALQKSVAIVGSRGATTYGELSTDLMVSTLVPKGFSIVSGGAYGIDGVAHRSTLSLQGNTVAVMAGGVDRFYPTGNSDLLKRISQTGAVMSELPPGSTPTKWRFLQRNRLIAALAQSTLVVEANWRSGALNTVSHSERLNREVFAIPGPISSPKSAGTNKLIADGRAQLVVDGQDLLDRLGVQVQMPNANQLAGMGAIEVRVLDAIGFSSLEISEICSAAGLTRDEARFGLANLELDGLVLRRDSTWMRSQTNL